MAISCSDTKVFGGLRGNAIGRDIFLDGNTFKDSHSVSKYPVTYESEIGLATDLRKLSIAWRLVTKSKEFSEWPESTSFASVSLVVLPGW